MKVRTGSKAYIHDKRDTQNPINITECRVTNVIYNTVCDVSVELDDISDQIPLCKQQSDSMITDLFEAFGSNERYIVAFSEEKIRECILKEIDKQIEVIERQKQPLLEQQSEIQRYLDENVYYKVGDILYYSFIESYSDFLPRKATVIYIKYRDKPSDLESMIIENEDGTKYDFSININSKQRVVKSSWRVIAKNAYIWVCGTPELIVKEAKRFYLKEIQPYKAAIEDCDKFLKNSEESVKKSEFSFIYEHKQKL